MSVQNDAVVTTRVYYSRHSKIRGIAEYYHLPLKSIIVVALTEWLDADREPVRMSRYDPDDEPINVRIPRGIHADLVAISRGDGVLLSSVTATALREWLEAPVRSFRGMSRG
jgi:hypothetical protein